MGTLYVSEYTGVVTLGTGDALPVGQEPALKVQTIPIEDEAHASQPFQTATRFVRLHADVPCSIRFGGEASTKDARLVGTEVFGVKPPGNVSVIANQAATTDGASIFALLQVIADPKAAEKRWNELTMLNDDAKARLKAATERERAIVLKEAGLATREQTIAQAEAQLRADQQALGRARSEHNGHVEDFTAKQQERDRVNTDMDKDLADRRDNLDHEEAAFKEWSDKAKAELEVNLAQSIQHEIALHEREDRLAAAEKDYAARLTRLKELAA